MANKYCYRCKKELLITEFYKNKSKEDGLSSECKECKKLTDKKYNEKYYARPEIKIKRKEQGKIYRKNNRKQIKERIKNWQENHKEQEKERSKDWYIKNKEKRKIYVQRNKEKINKIKKIWYENNKERTNINQKNRLKININYRISCYLRNRINSVLKGINKSTHSINLLGCSIEELKQHLEKQFTSGMNWSNYGRGWNGKGMVEWHIDHIRPCASFDLSKPSEQYKCFHYTNLQPLWAKENMSKNDKFLGENNE